MTTLKEFRAFVVQELPSRIVNDINNHLRLIPEAAVVGNQMTSILRETIQEVLGEFLHIPTGNHEAPNQAHFTNPETAALTTGNVSTLPSYPLDMTSMCEPSWLWPQVSDETTGLTSDFDLAWDPSFMVDDGR